MIAGVDLTGRSYFRAYRSSGRGDMNQLVVEGLEAGGATVLWRSPDSTAPLYLAVRLGDGGLCGVLVYAYRATRRPTRNRPQGEIRFQIKYGDITEETRRQNHSLGLDPTGLDVTLLVAVDVEHRQVVALDPPLYDPLPMGLSSYWHPEEAARIEADGWHAWDSRTRSGSRREARHESGMESRVGLRPERLVTLLALEREARQLGHDTALRLSRARALADPQAATGAEASLDLGLTAEELVEVIASRMRLAMAVRGGVAEFHAHRQLEQDPLVVRVEPHAGDGPPDHFATLRDGRRLRVEVKNAAPDRYADGTAKVEVQKTRGQVPARLYPYDAFDVLAVCMHGPTGQWDFRYRHAHDLDAHPAYPDRIRPMQPVDEHWPATLADLLS